MGMSFKQTKKVLTKHRKHLTKLGARSVAVFGSTAREEAKEKSDVDILVDFDAKKGFFVFADLKFYLEKILHSEVDLVSKRALHPSLKKRILDEAKQVF